MVRGSTKIAVVRNKALRGPEQSSLWSGTKLSVCLVKICKSRVRRNIRRALVPDHGELCSGPRRSLLNHGRADKTGSAEL